MALSSEQLRTLLLEFSKGIQRNEMAIRGLQESTCVSEIEHLLSKDSAIRLSEDERKTLRHVIWDLILGRILIPGRNEAESNAGWPHLALTDHGDKVVSSLQPTPYDPDKYLDRLRCDSPQLHSTVLRYVEESVATFRSDCYLASIVMLGAALLSRSSTILVNQFSPQSAMRQRRRALKRS